MRALHNTPTVVSVAAQLLILTGARSHMMRFAQWDEFDPDLSRWSLPAERMKTREPFAIPLAPEVVELVKTLPHTRVRSPYLFPSNGRKRLREAVLADRSRLRRGSEHFSWINIQAGTMGDGSGALRPRWSMTNEEVEAALQLAREAMPASSRNLLNETSLQYVPIRTPSLTSIKTQTKEQRGQNATTLTTVIKSTLKLKGNCMNLSDKEVNEQHRTRALTKLHSEIKNDIYHAVEIAKLCGLWDLLRLLYEFRLARSVMVDPERKHSLSKGDLAALHLNDEAMKYAISLVAKHGKWNDPDALESPMKGFDISRVHQLEKMTRHINAKFESEILLNIAEVRVSGKRDEHCLVKPESVYDDPQRIMHLQFGLRLENFTSDEKNDSLPIAKLIEKFKHEYTPLSELYALDNGISIDDYCKGMLDIHDSIVKRGMEADVEFIDADNDLVDPFSPRTFVNVSRTFVMTIKEMNESLSPNFIDFIKRNPFDPEAVSDSELRYHYVSRRPFLVGNGFTVFSPELVFDSMLGNTHYTFLESMKSKQKYMELSSSQFINEITKTAAQAGYQEIGRDIYLKEGKKDIGDIDLFLWNRDTDHCLLIEAKNHMLPLPVYFRSPEAVEQHIIRNRDWENKVHRRIAHLTGDDTSFCITNKWDYLVVSLMPEPLAHVTDLLILSLGEFKHWLSQTPRPSSFAELHEILHDPKLTGFTLEDMQHMQEDGFVLLNPLK